MDRSQVRTRCQGGAVVARSVPRALGTSAGKIDKFEALGMNLVRESGWALARSVRAAVVAPNASVWVFTLFAVRTRVQATFINNRRVAVFCARIPKSPVL